jgi:hypothetical protein
MAEGTTNLYYGLKNDLFTKVLSFTADTINIALYNTSGTFLASDTAYATTNELTSVGGYTQGGIALGTKAVSGTGTVHWTAAASQWTSSGTGFTAYYAKVYSITNSNRLICHIDLNGPKTASGGGTFTITYDTNGIISMA